MINPHSYNISIRQAEFDGDILFEARIAEFPDVSEYGETYDEAYELAIDTIETTAEMFAEKSKAMPEVIEPLDDYSGRVTLRMTKSLHKELAYSAEYEGVSLNHHITSLLQRNYTEMSVLRDVQQQAIRQSIGMATVVHVEPAYTLNRHLKLTHHIFEQEENEESQWSTIGLLEAGLSKKPSAPLELMPYVSKKQQFA